MNSTSRSWFLLILIAIGGITQAVASDFYLDFGGLKNNEEVLSYYDGGFGSLGSGPGPNYGITFTPTFVAVQAVPPYGPDRAGLLNGTSAIMDVSGGFTNLLSFYYQATDNSGLVTIWSGLDGTGTELATIPLSQSDFWNADGTAFSGTAMSVVFSGTPDALMFDIINNQGLVIPEPSSLILFGTGLAGLFAGFRQRRR